MTALGLVIGENVKRLRADRNWSQDDLAGLLADLGGTWRRGTIGMLESKGVRAERVTDVAALCLVFEVPMAEFLRGGDAIDVAPGTSWPADRIVAALDGKAAKRPRSSKITKERMVSGLGEHDPQEVRRMAKHIGVSSEELLEATQRMTGGWESPLLWRDWLAEIDRQTPRGRAQAKRGHATRKIAAWIKSDLPAEHEPQDAYRAIERFLKELESR